MDTNNKETKDRSENLGIDIRKIREKESVANKWKELTNKCAQRDVSEMTLTNWRALRDVREAMPISRGECQENWWRMQEEYIS